jgi:hypothetical protein
MHQIQALHLHQTRDLVSGTIRTRREEDVTGEHEERQVCTSSAILIKRSELVRQKPLCALVDAVDTNQYNRFFCRIQDVLGPTQRRTKTGKFVYMQLQCPRTNNCC